MKSASLQHGDADTRERVLAAARELFATRGFRDVTIREICAAASANVAAVNYHFGDKRGLYRAVLDEAITAMRQTTELAAAAGIGKRPEERLREFVRITLARVGRGTHAIHQIVQREIAEPTPALDDILDRAIRPRVEYISGIVAEITGLPATDPAVLRCAVSIHVQFVMAMPNPIAARFKTVEPEGDLLDLLTEHITTFSIGGIYAMAALRRRRGGA